MKDTAIIGLGNPLMSDEGIGVHLASNLSKWKDLPDNIEVLDMGTGGLSVVHTIARFNKVIFIDCALMGEDAGAIRRFKPSDVVSTKIGLRYSAHESDLLSWLDLSSQLGECPDDIIIFGIQPALIDNGQSLTDTLLNNIDHYLEVIRSEVVSQ